MKRIIGLLILVFLTSLTSETKEHKCTATHYDTEKFPIVHRKHSTAAISYDLIKRFKIKVGKKEKRSSVAFGRDALSYSPKCGLVA